MHLDEQELLDIDLNLENFAKIQIISVVIFMQTKPESSVTFTKYIKYLCWDLKGLYMKMKLLLITY